MRQPLLFSLLLLISLGARSQSPADTARTQYLQIRLHTERREKLPPVSVLVVNRSDSSLQYKAVSDSAGQARLQLPVQQQYRIFISAVNFEAAEKGVLMPDHDEEISMLLTEKSKTLSTVVVRSAKPVMRQEEDKLIVEPENLVAASTNGYEVLEKTPGLFIDQDGNIYISSLSPATVQINGRDLKMSTADVASMLKSLPPQAVQKIEIVRTPSAKYDAGSSGGVVNVVLKKGIKLGMTGSVNSGMQQGKYNSAFTGFNLNNSNGNRSLSVNLNYNHRRSFEEIETDRLFAADTVLQQHARTVYPADVFFGNYVYSWTHQKWEFEISGQGTLTNSDNKTNNRNDIVKQTGAELLSSSLNQVGNKGFSFVTGNGFETKYKLDTTGSEWTTQVFYYYSAANTDQAYNALLISPVNQSTGGSGTADNKRDFISGRTDLKLKLKNKFTVESGLRSTVHIFRNNTAFEKTDAGGQTLADPARTNRFRYKENINSVYVQGSKTFAGDVVLKTGLRMENTNMNGHQFIPADTNFAVHRTDFFPYVFLSRKLMKIAGYELRTYLVYRRSITRPVYEQLDPYSRYIDAYMSESGNPGLRPQFTQNYEANVSVDERPILAVGVNDTKDIFTTVVYPSPRNPLQAYRTYDNLGHNKEWYLRGLGALPPGGRYFLVAGAQYNHNFYSGQYNNAPLYFKKGTWTFFTYQTLKLDKRSVLTLNGFLRLRGQQQFYELSEFGALNASVNRQFFNKKLTATISLSDLFLTNRNRFTIDQTGMHASGLRSSDSRRFGINLRYNFGIKKKEERENPFGTENPEKNN